MECYTAALSRFSSTAVKIYLISGQLSSVGILQKSSLEIRIKLSSNPQKNLLRRSLLLKLAIHFKIFRANLSEIIRIRNCQHTEKKSSGLHKIPVDWFPDDCRTRNHYFPLPSPPPTAYFCDLTSIQQRTVVFKST